MSSFADHAERILEAAEAAGSCSDMTILLGQNGIRMIADSDWPLDSLLAHHGAHSAYRVSERQGHVRVEGREGSRHCIMESRSHLRTAQALLARQ